MVYNIYRFKEQTILSRPSHEPGILALCAAVLTISVSLSPSAGNRFLVKYEVTIEVITNINETHPNLVMQFKC